MAEENTSSSTFEFDDLKKRVSQDSIRTQFRSQVIGGFNQEDVSNYITYLEDKFRKLEQNDNERNKEYLSVKEKLAAEKEEKRLLQESLENAQVELEQYVSAVGDKESELLCIKEKEGQEAVQLREQMQQLTDEREALKAKLSESGEKMLRLTESAADLEQKHHGLSAELDSLKTEMLESRQASEETARMLQEYEQQLQAERSNTKQQSAELELLKQKLSALEEAIAEKTEEAEIQKRNHEKIEEELKQEKVRAASHEISTFKDEIVGIYKVVETMKNEQITITNDLKQQVEEEKNRAKAAEDTLLSISKWISETKDNLYSEQRMLENQLKQSVESRSKLHDEMDARLAELKQFRSTTESATVKSHLQLIG